MRRIMSVVVVASLIALASCGGDDGPAGPNGNGGNTVTLLDGADSASWTSWDAGNPSICWNAGVLEVRSAVGGVPTCLQNGRTCKARSKAIDFRPYASVRLQGTVRLVAAGQGARARVRIEAFSGVPGTPGFAVYHHDTATAGTHDETIDLSLANALGFSEGGITVEYYALSAEDGRCGNESFVEVRDLRIVAQR